MRIIDLSQHEFAEVYRIYSAQRKAEKLEKKRTNAIKEKNK
jgi:hypothetical protein